MGGNTNPYQLSLQNLIFHFLACPLFDPFGRKKMTCFVPFNSRNLDISFFVFRPVVVLIDELIEALKNLSLSSEGLGCVYSSIFKSIHGNMIVWYGAWMKRSNEKKELLISTIMSMLQNVSGMAILLDHSFFDAYAGESKDGFPAAKFSTGDTISLSSMTLSSNKLTDPDISYACLALFKSYFLKMEGVISGVCCKGSNDPRVACLYVWKSLHSCYSWLLRSDFRTAIQPYIDPIPLDLKYDIFRVVYVCNEDIHNTQFVPPRVVQNGGSNEVA